jgi:hypothetical protein
LGGSRVNHRLGATPSAKPATTLVPKRKSVSVSSFYADLSELALNGHNWPYLDISGHIWTYLNSVSGPRYNNPLLLLDTLLDWLAWRGYGVPYS